MAKQVDLEQTIELNIMGTIVKVDRYADCNRCGAKKAVKWDRIGYAQPCNKCKDTKEYEQEMKNRKSLKDNSISDVFKKRTPASAWEYKGRLLTANSDGNIIKDEPIRR